MKIFSQSTMPANELGERAARICYDTVDKFGRNPKFLENVITYGHLSVLEHWSVTIALATEELNEYDVMEFMQIISTPGVTYKSIGFTHYVTLNHRHLIELQQYKLIQQFIEELGNES